MKFPYITLRTKLNTNNRMMKDAWKEVPSVLLLIANSYNFSVYLELLKTTLHFFNFE
jgi:hypothetical protein